MVDIDPIVSVPGNTDPGNTDLGSASMKIGDVAIPIMGMFVLDNLALCRIVPRISARRHLSSAPMRCRVEGAGKGSMFVW